MGRRAPETHDAWVGSLILVGIMAAHAVSETARDALFLTHLPPSHLPWAYLTIAVLALGAAKANEVLFRRFGDKRRVLSVSLALGAMVTGSFGVWLGRANPLGAYVLYVWTGLAATVTVVQLWLLLDNVVTVTQAKRVFGFVAAGGVIGATAGALLADRLSVFLAPNQLLFAASALLVLTALVPFAWSRQHVGAPPAPRSRLRTAPNGLRVVCTEPYLRRLLMLVVASTIALTAVDYLFKHTVAREVAQAALGPFFARVHLVVNGMALVVQLAFSSWLLGYVGVGRAMRVLPILLVAGILGFAAAPGLAAALMLKGAEGSLRHSVHRTGLEVLYLPLGSDVRERYKSLIDGVGSRGGQALASLGILAALAAGASPAHLAMGVGVIVVAWLVSLKGVKDRYVDLFRSNLRGGMIQTRVDLAELDLHSFETLVAALNSERDEEVLTALDLFELHDRRHLVPALILYHPSRAIVLRALDMFAEAGRRDFVPVARRLMHDEDDEIRSAALRAITVVEPDEARLREALEDESPTVHATALVGMLAHGYGDRRELEQGLAECVERGGTDVQCALARAIRRERAPGFVSTLSRLGETEDVDVRLEVARAMEVLPDEQYLDTLLPMLGYSKLRRNARQAIAAVGAPALAYLDRALDDPRISHHVRRHLPRTISRFDPRRAAEIMLRRLEREEDGAVRYKILRGLGRIRTDHPDVPMDRKRLEGLLRQTLARVIRFLSWRMATERAHQEHPRLRTPGGELLIAVLREKEENALERTFRLLGLLYRREDFELLWHGLHSAHPKTRAASREVLAHVVRGHLREAVLALVEESSDTRKLERISGRLGVDPSRPTYRERLEAMLQDESEAVRSVAAHHIGELGLAELADALRRAKPVQPSFLTEVIERALQTVQAPTVQRVPDVA